MSREGKLASRRARDVDPRSLHDSVLGRGDGQLRTLSLLFLAATVVSVSLSACSSSDDEPGCGDGRLGVAEECDDGNHASGDGCTAACHVEPGWHCQSGSCATDCGDGVVAGDEVCDHASSTIQPYCADDCSGEIGKCGDGIIQPQSKFSSETCDSGPATPGCKLCKVVFGFVCGGSPSTCVQTGLDPEKLLSDLTPDEQLTFCSWLTAIVGGVGTEWQCGDVSHTIYTPQQCVAKLLQVLPTQGDCSIGAVEAFIVSLGSECVQLSTPQLC